MRDELDFRSSELGTLGVELELQLLDPETLDLTPAAPRLLGSLAERPLNEAPSGSEIKPEITQAMIEISTGVQPTGTALHDELRALVRSLSARAAELQLRIGLGGTHPYQRWTDRRIYPSARYEYLYEHYGYLAQQFTVFGQHVHVGVGSGKAAVRLTHALGAYVPHFIALAASSPYQEGVDTRYDCSRLSAVTGFPLSGRLPDRVQTWAAFVNYFERLRGLGVASSLKDLYWDIRPKPNYGTIELRVMDVPLRVSLAAAIAALAQALVAWLSDAGAEPGPYLPDVYEHNRFTANRYGLQASHLDPHSGARAALGEHLSRLIDQLSPYWERLGSTWAADELRRTLEQGNGATVMRRRVAELGTQQRAIAAQLVALRAELGG